MKTIALSLEQSLINKINGRKSFAYSGNKSYRYLVPMKNLFVGSNPSLCYDEIYEDIDREVKAVDSTDSYTLSGWYDKPNKVYYVDLMRGFNFLDTALWFANGVNQGYVLDTETDKLIKIGK